MYLFVFIFPKVHKVYVNIMIFLKTLILNLFPEISTLNNTYIFKNMNCILTFSDDWLNS